MHEIVELVRALAWPATVLCIVLLLRRELRTLTQNFAERMETDTIEIGVRGVTITSSLPQSVQERKVRLRRYIAAVDDRAVLESLARRLNISAGPTAANTRKLLIAEMTRRVASEGDMDRLSAALRRISKQDF